MVPGNKHIHLAVECTVTSHSSNQLSVFSVHLNEAFIRWLGLYWHHRFQLSLPHCFPAEAIEFVHFGWFRLDLLSSNFKAYNLIVGICCPTVMTTFHMVLTEGPQNNFTGSGVHCKNFSQTYLGFSFSSRSPSSALKISSGAVKVWILTSQCRINVSPQVFFYLRKSLWEGWTSHTADRTHHTHTKKHLAFYCHFPMDVRLAWQCWRKLSL